jgi:hypothetical protein
MSILRNETRSREATAHERNSGEIPENDHKAPLLMEHVPSLRNAFFTLAAILSPSEEPSLRGNIPMSSPSVDI